MVGAKINNENNREDLYIYKPSTHCNIECELDLSQVSPLHLRDTLLKISQNMSKRPEPGFDSVMIAQLLELYNVDYMLTYHRINGQCYGLRDI